MQHAYGSLNKVLTTLWATVASGEPITIGGTSTPLPASGLRVIWESNGDPDTSPTRLRAVVDLAIVVPPIGTHEQAALAQKRASDLATALGFRGNAGYGRMGRYDWTDPNAPVYLTDMELYPEAGWVRIDGEASPGTVHLAQTAILRYIVPATQL